MYDKERNKQFPSGEILFSFVGINCRISRDLSAASFSYSTSALRLLALRGLRTLCVRGVALRAPGMLNLNYFWNFPFPLYIYCKQRSTKIFSYGSENMIFEIYTPENPMSTVESKFLAYF